MTASRLRKKFSWLSKVYLEGEHSVVAWIFCINSRNRSEENIKMCKMAREPGFRSSEALVIISTTALTVGIYK